MALSRLCSWALCATVVLAGAAAAQAPADTKCDSILAASVVDQISRGLYLSVQRSDGGELSAAQASRMVMSIGAAFVAPRPFKLSVFAGPSLMRGLRPLSGAAAPVTRAPTLTGVYRLWITKRDETPKTLVIRQSLVEGFDSAAVEAITTGAGMRDSFRPVDEDSLRLDVNFSTDSMAGARILATGSFPRMPIVDAAPLPTNLPAKVPETVASDTTALTGPVILRFVIAGDGTPAGGTVEVMKAPSVELLRAAMEALATHRFTPATVRGCPVAQQVDYPFVFARPSPP